MKEKLELIAKEAESAINGAASLKELEEIKVRFLGKKGELTSILKMMGGLTPEERPIMGQKANEVRSFIEGKLESTVAIVKEKELEELLKELAKKE